LNIDKEETKMAIERVEVLDYVEFGKKVVGWALEPGSRPRDLATLKVQLRDILVVPDRITTVKYVDVGLDELVIRLPNPSMAQESLELFGQSRNSDDYPTPLFYRNLRTGGGSTMSKLDTLFARIADYTIAQCR